MLKLINPQPTKPVADPYTPPTTACAVMTHRAVQILGAPDSVGGEERPNCLGWEHPDDTHVALNVQTRWLIVRRGDTVSIQRVHVGTLADAIEYALATLPMSVTAGAA